MFRAQELLRQLLPCTDAPAWWLGLSGGMDSMVLLDALVELRREHSIPPLHAIHVHHGLHPDADQWAEHCAREAAARQVPLVIERVQLASGASIEARARDARYAAFARHMGPGDCLLLAHHRDDQLETLLFRMLRGTGLHGLAGMPRRRPVAAGTLIRPLLDQPRTALLAYATARELAWVEDPANTDPRFARSALRHDLLPMLRKAWPAVDGNLARLAAHAREANELLDERAAEDLQRLVTDIDDPWLTVWPSLSAGGLLQLSTARRRNLLRYWLRLYGLSLSQDRLHDLESQLAGADDSQPAMELPGAWLHRSAGRLWLLQESDLRLAPRRPLGGQGEIELEEGNGALLLHLPAVNAGDMGQWSLNYRQGGERIRLPGRPSQSLKHLLQEANIPVWLRPRIPLIYHAGELVSVGGRWNNEAHLRAEAGEGWRIRWLPGGFSVSSGATGSDE